MYYIMLLILCNSCLSCAAHSDLCLMRFTNVFYYYLIIIIGFCNYVCAVNSVNFTQKLGNSIVVGNSLRYYVQTYILNSVLRHIICHKNDTRKDAF